jgi:hypothetical protein
MCFVCDFDILYHRGELWSRDGGKVFYTKEVRYAKETKREA